ncbi:MAG: ABC transporter permease [Nitrolancea sp.]
MQVLHAEWTKLRTVSTTIWLFFGTVALSVAVSAAVAATTHVSSAEQQDPTSISLTGIDLGQAVVAILAILVISEEYGNGMIRVSLTATPRRLVLFAAKSINVAVVVLVAGLVAVAGCLLVGRFILPGARLDAAHGYALISLSHGSTLRAAVGSVVYLILIALLSLGVATAVRDTAVSIGVVLGLLYLFPILAQVVSNPTWHRHLEQISPMIAGLAIQRTTDLAGLPIRPWAGLGVVVVWAALALLIGGVLLYVRDA